MEEDLSVRHVLQCTVYCRTYSFDISMRETKQVVGRDPVAIIMTRHRHCLSGAHVSRKRRRVANSDSAPDYIYYITRHNLYFFYRFGIHLKSSSLNRYIDVTTIHRLFVKNH